MKNVHILPTDKPSRLFDFMTKLMLIDKIGTDEGNMNRHIYITNDEEIKEGDWGYRDSGIVFKMTQELLVYYESIKDNDTHKRYKIILTTDQDLIKDGIQAIDNEFLEWFVKNPSCEEVEIEEVYPLFCCIQKEGKTKMNNGCMERNRCLNYKIIIPKEENSIEAKQRAANYMSLKGALEPKQETLEEAACIALGYGYDYWLKLHCKDQSSLVYIEVTTWCKGAKWQAERMYSEAIEFAEWIRNNPYVWNYPDKLNDTRTTEELFEQFKKK